MQNLREREVNMIGKLLSLQSSGMQSCILSCYNIPSLLLFYISILFTASDNTQDEFVDYWKVLIYDEDCRDIISPLMNVGALRQKGVTLHLLVCCNALFLFYFYILETFCYILYILCM